jgi:hypothetical protein
MTLKHVPFTGWEVRTWRRWLSCFIYYNILLRLNPAAKHADWPREYR